MLNVIIPITQNAGDFTKILSRLGNIESVTVHVGVNDRQYNSFKNQFGDSTNIFLHAFQDGSNREEIINALQLYVGDGATMIMRKPISMEEFNKFITQKKDVVTCKKENGKFKAFFLMLWQKILKLFLGVKLYEGETSVVYFGEDLSAVLSQSGNLSYSSRVDRWRGIEQGVVETKGTPVKTEVDKKSSTIFITCAIISVVLAIVVTTLVCIFAKVNIIIGLLIACLDIIALAIAVILSVIVIFNNIVGKRHFNRAFEIDKEVVENNE